MRTKFRHDMDNMDCDTLSIGKGSGNGTIKEIKRALDKFFKKRKIRRKRYTHGFEDV